MTTFVIIIGIILFLIIGILFIGFLNQIGRALVGSLFTTENIELHFGSFPNDNEESFDLKLGRFKLFFAKNYCWFQGSCRFLDTLFLSIQKKIITIGATSVAFLFSALVYYFVTKYDFHKNIQIASILFFVSTCINILGALVSKENFIEDTIGTTLDNYMYDNDGNQKHVNIELNKVWQEALLFLDRQDYEKAIPLLQEVVEKSKKNLAIIETLFHCYIATLQLQEAEKLIDYLENNFDLNTYHYCNFGWIKSNVKKYKKSLYYYQKSLELDNKNTSTFNNRGFTYNILERYEEAILDFNEAIQLEPDSAYAHNNRGLSKIKLGKTEEGLKDIETSMRLDDTNSYAYRNLGIYHFDKKEYETALENFEKSYQLDNETHLIEEHIRETKAILNKLNRN